MKLTNAQVLCAAAYKLTELAESAASEMAENTFWRPYAERTNWRDGFGNGFGGAPGELAGSLHPQVCLAVAASWRQMSSFAAKYDEMAADHDRSGCDDFTCEAMGLAIESAKTFLKYL